MNAVDSIVCKTAVEEFTSVNSTAYVHPKQSTQPIRSEFRVGDVLDRIADLKAQREVRA